MITFLTSLFARDTYCYQQVIVDQAYGSVSLILYSHIPTALIALVVGLYMRINNKTLESKIFSFLTLAFFLFTVGEFIEWFMFVGRDVVMISRSIIQVVDPLLFVLASYLLYVLINKKDVPLYLKTIWLLPFIPMAVAIILEKNLIGYNWQICEVMENPTWTDNVYYLDLFYLVSALIFALWSIIKARGNKKEIVIISAGVSSFMVLFFVMEYVFTGYIFSGVFDYNYFLYAFFGMPILIVILAYLTIEFHTFNIKMITTQIFAWGAVGLVFSQFFFLDNTTSLVLNGVNIFLVAILGDLIARNVKREIKHRENIEKLAADLEKANRQKDAVLHMVAHQFRRPVTEINYMTELLLDGSYGTLTEAQRESIGTIQKASAKMGSQSELVLDAAKITSGELPLHIEPVNVRDLLTEIAETAEQYAKEMNVGWSASLPAARLSTVMLDRKYTQLAIDNLVNNAIKYTALRHPDGTGTVEFSVKVKDRTLLCTIRDNGIGIPEADKEKMFKELSRASNAGKDGNGLGLHVAKGAIEAQGGKIRFESTENVGTTFFVDMPLKVATKEEIEQQKMQATAEKAQSAVKKPS